MNSIDLALLIFLFGFAPIGFYVFGGKVLTYQAAKDIWNCYKLHFGVIAVIYSTKNVLDFVNDPIKDALALDFTPWVMSVEGDAALHVQRALESYPLTVFLIIVYLLGYMFVYNFTFALFAFLDERKVANDVIFTNLIILLISIPFYTLTPVYVTSYPRMWDPSAEAVLPGMKALIYNFNPALNEFFKMHDPFDNCFPSLHIAVPVALILILYRRTDGYKLYKGFMLAMTALTALAIIYLGVHWIIDIFAGIGVALVAVWLTNRYSDRFWDRVNGGYARAVRWYEDRKAHYSNK